MSRFKVESAILCEDIRQEKSNKFLLIGVYSGPILVAQLPASIPLALLVIGNPQAARGDFYFRFSGPGENTGTLKLQYAKSPENPFVALRTPVLEIALGREGTLLIESSTDGVTFKKLLSRDIKQQDGL